MISPKRQPRSILWQRLIAPALIAGTLSIQAGLYIGCAGQAPPRRDQEPAAGARLLPEEFDPQTLNEELLIIQPRFSPPAAGTVGSMEPGAPTAADPERAPAHRVTGAAPQHRIVHRVQLMALSNPGVAHQRRQELADQINEPVVLQAERGLFIVRAGAYDRRADAEELRARLVRLSPEFAEAYVVSGPMAPEEETAETDRRLPDTSPETPVGPEVVAGLLHADEPPPPSVPPVMVHAFGWRVLLDKTLAYEEALQLQQRAMDQLRRSDVDITFSSPWYNIELGHFRTDSEAQQALENLRRHFPNALRIRGQILVPVEE